MRRAAAAVALGVALWASAADGGVVVRGSGGGAPPAIDHGEDVNDTNTGVFTSTASGTLNATCAALCPGGLADVEGIVASDYPVDGETGYREVSCVDTYDAGGSVYLDAENLRVRCSRIDGGGRGGNEASLVAAPQYVIASHGSDGDGFVLEDSELAGSGCPNSGGACTWPQGRGKCIYTGGNDMTLRRVNVHECGDAIHVGGGTAALTLEEVYCHGLTLDNDEHADCVQWVSGAGPHLLDKVHLRAPWAQNSALFISADSGTLANIETRDSKLVGGGYTIYHLDQFPPDPGPGGSGKGGGDCPQNVAFTNNIISNDPADRQYGFASVGSSDGPNCGSGTPGWVWTGNVDHVGAPLSSP